MKEVVRVHFGTVRMQKLQNNLKEVKKLKKHKFSIFNYMHHMLLILKKL